jgi:beta-glucanase (GH16 family)
MTLRTHCALPVGGSVALAILAAGCAAPSSTEDATRGAQSVTAGNIFNFGAIVHPGSCMDAQGQGTGDGTQIQEWDCNGTGGQSYRLDDAGGGAFHIVNTEANKCVDVQSSGTANGTKIQLWDCNGSGAQTFATRDAGDGFIYFVNTNSNKCLDVQAANPNDGTVVQLYACNGTVAQRWNPTVIGTAPAAPSAPSAPTGGGSTGPTGGASLYNFGALAHPGSCMDAQGDASADGTQIQEWNCNGTGGQSYQLTDAGGGAVHIFNAQANKCVDVQGAGTANGTKVQLWDCNGTDAQTYTTREAGNGFINFVNTNSGKCLDVQGDNANDGTLVQLYDCNGSDAQRWNPTVIGAASAAPTGGGGGTTTGGATAPAGWTLTWSDEFDGPDGSGVDASKWSFDTGGGGWGNNELEYYTSGTSNAAIQGGSLVITATPNGASGYSCWYGPCQYTSARLNTSGKFSQQYGRFEARIKMPEGQGVWPAFWMLGDNIGSAGWPACGEIDIMENIGRTPNTNYGTTHGPGPGSYPGTGLSGQDSLGAPLGNDFHVYATEWDASSVRFYLDGNLYWTVTPDLLPAGATWVWDQPFFLLLNFAVGGNWPGSPDGTTAWPQQMEVDYVRVYQPG